MQFQWSDCVVLVLYCADGDCVIWWWSGSMEAIEELEQLGDAMRQAAALLADEDVNEAAASNKRPSTFLNVVALGNTVCFIFSAITTWFVEIASVYCMMICLYYSLDAMPHRVGEFWKYYMPIFLWISICKLDGNMGL